MSKLNIYMVFSVLCSLFFINSCNYARNERVGPALNFTSGNTVITRIEPPSGFTRLLADSGTFGYYLQNLPLKPLNSPVRFYNGEVKSPSYHDAVIDISTGNKDLQQCADAIMRLRAEYLFHTDQHEQIVFHFTNGFKAGYNKWKHGYRIQITGNKVNWQMTAGYDDSYSTFLKYMEMVFIYSGTMSLSRELVQKSIEELQPGDVFIQGGNPGHAILVVDKAVNKNTGEVVFLLAQSYMPAQDVHILLNTGSPDLSPWYSTGFDQYLETPEWTFTKSDLKRF